VTAVDTNILVYASRADSPFYEAAEAALDRLAGSGQPWAIPWQCIHEFLAIVTHPRIYRPPTPLSDALIQVDCWLECRSLTLIGELQGYWDELRPMAEQARLTGPRFHDARVAAVCRQHGVETLWSADRDLSRFDGIRVVNPLLP